MKVLSLLLIFAGAMFLPEVKAQALSEPRQSPMGISRILVDDTYIKITYGRPYVREREIFGGLVPFGSVWRTGANEATEITVTRDVIMDGNHLEAGTYSIFTIPEEDEWTVIVNSGLGQWGQYSYDSELDVFRFTRPTYRPESHVELFTISTTEHEGDGDQDVDLYMRWDHTEIHIPIKLVE